MDKPKEFWIFPQKGNDCEWTNLYPDASWKSGTKPLVHVIEYSAYEQLQKRFEEAVEILKIYAADDFANAHANQVMTVEMAKEIYSYGSTARYFVEKLDKEKK